MTRHTKFLSILLVVLTYASGAGGGQLAKTDLEREVKVQSGGYAFQSPKGWDVYPESNGSVALFSENASATAALFIMDAAAIGQFLSFQKRKPAAINSNSLFQLFYEDLARQSTNNALSSVEHIQILNRAGYKGDFVINGYDGGNSKVHGQLAVVQLNDKQFFSLVGMARLGEWQHKKEFEAVLKSLRLLSSQTASVAAPISPAHSAPTIPPTAIPAKGEFSVQIASYDNAAEAREAARHLKSLGIDAEVVPAEIPNRGIWYRVQAGRFITAAEASQYGQQLQTKGFIKEFRVAKR